MSEMEPCPRCGAPAHVMYVRDIRFERSAYSGRAYRAECSDADCDADTYTRDLRDRAVVAWNSGAKAQGGE